MDPTIAPVSAVIPTLGGDSLIETISHLNRGTRVPAEILICIPEGFALPEDLPLSNVRVVRTKIRGQVNQRIVGFQQTTQQLVLQLDDDIWLDEQCLERLVECIQSMPGDSVSPSLLERSSGVLSHWMSRPRADDGFLRRALFRLINGARGYEAGRISRAGVGMGFSDSEAEPYEVEWLPGGCAIHHRHNAVTEPFYPFAGKAYAEDLFHSHALRRKHARLFHCPLATCRFDSTSSKSSGLGSFLKIHYFRTRALMSFSRLTGRSRWRLAAFLLLWPFVLVLERQRLQRRGKMPMAV
ncbi:MAG: glycosyltransferase [Gemmatimonadetes bacterium]|nr:glycosyltransferase [Gemmatimonadota bacterium]